MSTPSPRNKDKKPCKQEDSGVKYLKVLKEKAHKLRSL